MTLDSQQDKKLTVPFYCLYEKLCVSCGYTPSGFADANHFNRGTVTAWKKGKSSPNKNMLARLSDCFNVPVAFLTQSKPFDYWSDIEKDYRVFLKATGFSEQYLTDEYQFDFSSNTFDLKRLILFIDTFIESAEYKDGTWDIAKKYGNTLPKQDIAISLESIMEMLSNKNQSIKYRGTAISENGRDRLIWAIQLGLDAADGIIKNENAPS